MSDTPIDRAHAAMRAAPDDDAARLKFYERLADAELFLLLTEEPKGDDISPEIAETGDGPFLLAFDREDRLSGFARRAAPMAALSGRVLAQMITGQGYGIALNLDAASEELVAPAAVDWLAATLAARPAEIAARPSELRAPAGLPERLIEALDQKLSAAEGLARLALLAAVTYDDGRGGHMLAFVDAARGAEDALAQATGEALTFSGLDAAELDVAFFASGDPITERLARVALRFDLPVPAMPEPLQAPGSDPSRPPKLR
ncbi:SseB family protein [Anianabacter salinae]|uniref:SseB family protein n=1 Tax=Anianabacter salinae TaxID=2851023 RepID=UPI00225DD591|nr:SseB family protein [Anianabacter salinae]MBV0910975.1 SseB family protein [Anianabacter salinae]